jgi:SAM-dependent methyltransferase
MTGRIRQLAAAPRVPGAPRLVVPLTTPAVAEAVAAEWAAAGVPPASSRLLSFLFVLLVPRARRENFLLPPGGVRRQVPGSLTVQGHSSAAAGRGARGFGVDLSDLVLHLRHQQGVALRVEIGVALDDPAYLQIVERDFRRDVIAPGVRALGPLLWRGQLAQRAVEDLDVDGDVGDGDQYLLHLLDRDGRARTIAEIARVLREGGRVVTVTVESRRPCARAALTRLPRLSGLRPLDPRDELRAAGLEPLPARFVRDGWPSPCVLAQLVS